MIKNITIISVLSSLLFVGCASVDKNTILESTIESNSSIYESSHVVIHKTEQKSSINFYFDPGQRIYPYNFDKFYHLLFAIDYTQNSDVKKYSNHHITDTDDIFLMDLKFPNEINTFEVYEFLYSTFGEKKTPLNTENIKKKHLEKLNEGYSTYHFEFNVSNEGELLIEFSPILSNFSSYKELK